MPAPHRNAVSPKSVIAGHGVASQQRRSPAIGKLTGDKSTENEGKRDQAESHLKDAGEKVKDFFKKK